MQDTKQKVNKIQENVYQILRICLSWNMFLKTQDVIFTVQITFNASHDQQVYLLLSVPSILHLGSNVTPDHTVSTGVAF